MGPKQGPVLGPDSNLFPNTRPRGFTGKHDQILRIQRIPFLYKLPQRTQSKESCPYFENNLNQMDRDLERIMKFT